MVPPVGLLLLLFPLAATTKAQPPATLAGLVQDVTVCPRVGKCATAQDGEVLGFGATLKTGASAVQLVLRDGTKVVIAEQSEILFQEGLDLTLDLTGPQKANRIDLKKGDVRVTLPTGAKRPLLVVGPRQMLAAFRSGTGRAVLTGKALSALTQEGVAKVASRGRWLALAPYHRVLLRAEGNTLPPAPLPPAPSFSTQPCRSGQGKSCAIAIVPEGGVAPLGLSWEKIETATSYVVKVARDASLADEVRRQTLGAEDTSLVTPPLPAGSYFATMQVQYAEGLESRVSPVRPLRVLALRPQPGVLLTPDNAVIFPPGRSAMLLSPEGVEAARGQGGFSTAPTEIRYQPSLSSQELTFRVQGDTYDSATLHLEERKLQASVALTPMTARWPRDRVTLSITVSDPAGRIPVAAFTPLIDIRSNGVSCPTQLTRKGNTWTGVIPTGLGVGPWVLRVEVSDTEGNSLGRGHLEVVSDRPAKQDKSRQLLW